MQLIAEPKDRDCIGALNTMYPTEIEYREFGGRCGISVVGRPNSATSYVVCLGGEVVVTTSDPVNSFEMRRGNCSTFTGPFSVDAGDVGGSLVIITRYGYRGMSGLTMVEPRGRLTYIDGCTDTLLFGPHRLGDPCLNSLHFPKGTKQTQHLHPDIRMGVVLSGEGVAFREGVWSQPLKEGSIFYLPEGETHSFETGDSSMTVIAYHPTSDCGPTDEDHPMKSRTYIGRGK